MAELFNNEQEKRLFLALQEGIEISENPLKTIEEKLDLKQNEILGMYSSFVEKGLVRRFGAVFEPSKLGYQSLLCAVKVSSLDKIKSKILNIREITHCYVRDFTYNLWCTFTAKRDEFRAKFEIFCHFFDSEVWEFPVVKKFKTEVVFDLGLPVARVSCPCSSKNIIEFNSADIFISDCLYNFSFGQTMFSNIADTLGLSKFVLLDKIKTWQTNGALKRVGLIPYHMQIGYKANAMCVWKVEADKVDFIGKELSRRASITHCYERTPVEGKFPYNFFAMMHSNTMENLELEFSHINDALNLKNGRILSTITEVKKTSFKPF